ncbi:MAG: glycosyltransferase [Xanthomonadales bacterium]|nr:glycosyltransferase [Xanthomonadales bacterium]MCC6594967.1 glycosyltransferase [Rhodanobacteraceae bacterium]MDL1868152.1 glycosyltransferase [Gammaproteobacteria bacterium PRO6]
MSTRGASLIVLAWNQWPTTRRCLDSLLATLPFAARVIVVDNGSQDETPQALQGYRDRLQVVTLPTNLGFVRGMNAGITAAAEDDDLVLLNNDLVFGQADWLERLRDAAYADAATGIVGCRLRGPEPEGRLYHAGGFIEADGLWGQQTEAGLVERDFGQYPRTRRVQAIAFALAYLRRDCVDRIGGLDEAFHSYFEDTDYCLRAAAAGIATVNAGAVTLQHDQHGSTLDDGGFRRRLWSASRATFAARWQGQLLAGYRGNVLWQGSSRTPRAVAHLTRALLRRLDARGLRMSHEPLRSEVPDAQDFRLDLATRLRWPHPADAAIVCADGAHFARARARCRIGIGWTRWQGVDARWRAQADALDLLLVPDTFQRDTLLAAGVRTPMQVLPLGVDRDYCHPQVPGRDPAAQHFTFLARVEDLACDAPELLVAAFRAAFAPHEAVALHLHLVPGPQARAAFERIAAAAGDDPRVGVLRHWSWPWHQRARFLRSGDAWVAVRRDGGYDPDAADALACGLQLIASDFGSNGLLARAHGIAVATRRVRDPRSGLDWVEPEPDALVAALRAAQARAPSDAAAAAAAERFAAAHDIEASADALAAQVTALAGLRAAPAPVAPHQPAALPRRASGQLIVLGMHRAGTSSVAGLLARLGAYAGPETDLLVGPDNPKGHYESGRLHGACVRRLELAGGDWRSPPQSAPTAAVDEFRRHVGALIDEFDRQRPWLMKEPRLCLLVRELLPLLTRPLFVHVVRDPAAVVASLVRRDAMPVAQAWALWEHYTRAAFASSAGWPRLVVDYDALCAQPLAGARALLDALDAAGVAGLAWPGDAAISQWIDAPARSQVATGTPTPAQRALQAAIADRSILAADAAPATRGAA